MTAERFDAYMERCLYGPNGFYSSGTGSAGRRRDFITSPEVGPLFGAVLARAIDSWWHDLGCPAPFPVVDMGAGPRTLLKSLEVAAPDCAAVWKPISLDRADSVGLELPDIANGVIIANELLDNLAFRIVQGTSGGLREVWVSDGSEELRETDIKLDLDVGLRAPVFDAARRWVSWALNSGAARLLAFDYGMSSTADLASRGGWLRTYRAHVRGSDPYHEPGLWDITADVAFDQLPEPSELSSQAEFLSHWGIDLLVEEGRDYWRSHAAAPNLEALRMRSRITEAEALLDPNGLGGWLAGLWNIKRQ